MAGPLALTAALLLLAAPLRAAEAKSAAAQLGLPAGLRFRKSQARVVERLPSVNDPRRPWLKSTPDELTIDLRSQWEQATRRQGRYGTCAAFAAVAVAEAAVDRNARQCARFSEADLFLQNIVLKWDCWKIAGKDCETSQTGASVSALLRDLITRGVLPGDDYAKFMGAYQKALDDDHALAAAPARPESRRWWLRAFTAPVDWDFIVGLWERPDTHREIERYASESRRGDLARVRRAVARSFAGYRIERAAAENIKDRWKMKPGSECFQHGKAVARFIDGELLMGRPVAVGMYLEGLHWPTDAKDGYSGHAFVIDGLTLKRDADGVEKIYHTRNSWPAQPDVTAEQLCRVDQAVSLLGPAERDAPARPWAGLR